MSESTAQQLALDKQMDTNSNMTKSYAGSEEHLNSMKSDDVEKLRSSKHFDKRSVGCDPIIILNPEVQIDEGPEEGEDEKEMETTLNNSKVEMKDAACDPIDFNKEYQPPDKDDDNKNHKEKTFLKNPLLIDTDLTPKNSKKQFMKVKEEIKHKSINESFIDGQID